MTESRTPKRWRVVAACCAIAMDALGGAGCSDGAAESGGGQATGAESGHTDVQMSGGYEVGPDGKLLKPVGPEPELPTEPKRRHEYTEMGAEDFARYFISVSEYSWNSGDTTQFAAISTDECGMCTTMISAINSERAAGGWTDSLKYKIRQLQTPVQDPNNPEKRAVLILFEISAKGGYDGTALVPAEDVETSLELHTCWIADAWFACGGGTPREDMG